MPLQRLEAVTDGPYTQSGVAEMMQMVLRLSTSCLRLVQSMKEVFDVAEALEAIKKPPTETSQERKKEEGG